MEDASFYGYPRFDERSLELVALHDYYSPDGEKTTTSGARLTALLVTVGAVWCSPCIEEARVLPEVAEKFAPGGVAFVQDLFEGPNESSGAAATQSDLDGWITTYELPFPVFIDPAKKFAPYFDVAALPFVMLLDATSMRSIAEHSGFGGREALESFICDHAPEKPSVCP